MISHALIRNTVIPLVFIGYLFNEYIEDKRFDYVFYFLSIGCAVALPLTIFYALLGYTPVNHWITPTWRSIISPIQYLAFINVINYTMFKNTKIVPYCESVPYSFTLAVISAAAVGYLYEIPRWLQWDLRSVFRTARTSIIILDFGMVSVFLHLK